MGEEGIATNRWLTVGLSLLASLALIVSVDAAGANTDNTATTAKQKCKPGFKRVKVKGKKKCRKVVAPPATPAPTPAPAPAPGPTVRATLTWSADKDIDLYVWAPGGLQGSATTNAIPSTQFGPDSGSFGPETFTDLSIPSTREFSYGICIVDTPPAGSATLTWVYANGTSKSQVYSLNGILFQEFEVVPPGGFDPPAGWC